MKVIAGMITYTRLKTVDCWLKAWANADKPFGAELFVVHNQDRNAKVEEQKQNICKWKPIYIPRPNIGQDIGALRDSIRNCQHQAWDVLFWCVDDNIPMRKDFLSAFVTPFESNPNLGLVGNHWVKSSFYRNHRPHVPDHFRTTCFAISRNAALKLRFPTRLTTKWDCYGFEWANPKLNMTQQLRDNGFDMQPVEGDWNACWTNMSKYVWDTGHLQMKSRNPRCRRDHWAQYHAQFTEGNVCSAS